MKPKRLSARELKLLGELLYAGRALMSAGLFIRENGSGPSAEILEDANDCLNVVREYLGPELELP